MFRTFQQKSLRFGITFHQILKCDIKCILLNLSRNGKRNKAFTILNALLSRFSFGNQHSLLTNRNP